MNIVLGIRGGGVGGGREARSLSHSRGENYQVGEIERDASLPDTCKMVIN